jgi:hypothetical protein
LETWVEKGEVPGPQIVADTKEGNHGRTRPLCVYPKWPRYVSGDIDKAESFTCVDR